MSSRRSVPARYDVRENATNAADGSLHETIARHIAIQGYCIVKPSIKDSALKSAVQDVKTLDSSGVLTPTPDIIINGLLGEEGSVRNSGVLRADQLSELQALQDLDNCMSGYLRRIAGSAHSQGVSTDGRSGAVVHEAGPVQDVLPALTEADASEWLGLFTQQRLMLILFLGPARGVLELQPFDEDGNPVRMHTEPGMLAVVRADLLWRRHSSAPGQKCYALSCFALQKGAKPTGAARNPVAAQLDTWMLNRIEALAVKSQGDDADPRWTYALEHMYHQSQQYAVRGAASKFSVVHNPDKYHKILTTGLDAITEVPLARWDHTNYYSDDEDCWKTLKMNVKHTSVIDGLELFDAKFFRIAPAEVKGMDPMQRQILEVGYEALHAAGHTSRTLLQSLTAVYVGSPLSEWPMVDQGPMEEGGCAQRSAGTGFAASIMSNRFSFVFGMNGASVTFDTEASTSLIIMEAGITALNEKRENATTAALVGISVVLTPLTWLNRIALGHMCPKGRCFVFDECARGWVKSDAVGSLAMDRLTDTVEGKQVQDESRFYVGTVGSVSVKHMGQSATLGTPHGPSVQVLLAEACRQACISPVSMDAVECAGEAQLLNDAIEVNSTAKALCASQEGRVPLHLSAVKSNLGMGIHGSGMAQVIKVMMSQAYCTAPPLVHLANLSPHLQDAHEDEVSIDTEVMSYKTRTAIVGVTALGWGGTMGHAVLTCGMHPGLWPERAAKERMPQILIWPGGGGDTVTPREAYHVVGSWNDWAEGVPMVEEAPGWFAAPITLRSNFEEFRILVDGDHQQALEPSMDQTMAGSPAIFSTVAETSRAGPRWVLVSEDGKAGGTYFVRLVVAGKWKAVSWERREPAAALADGPKPSDDQTETRASDSIAQAGASEVYD
eukprot:TRINITY_DN23131_c0_g1_i1.p1 TRINITY_DN23131_c0_g1~~TRINITY_DN23131_c0_g1_i1.p1  ORF type:complete len:894 (-),score=143.51 TRINITY_DN23131_c0_g1_i1:2-2683(-)